MTLRSLCALVGAFVLALSGLATAHELDHAVPGFGPPEGEASTTVNSGGRNASWDLLDTVATGNPHTDIDFFEQNGRRYASVGTLAAGAGSEGGGQTILRLTNRRGRVDTSFVSAHPSAACPSDPAAALGLQHDIEATPKGKVLLSTRNRAAVRRDAQLLIDATDAPGRCHDQGPAGGIADAPQGGIEIVDITDVRNPVEIGLISHIGEAHTVNVDPKRPHIVYAVTSDSVSINERGRRENGIPRDNDRFDLDGFEVINIASCMNFPDGASIREKRRQCRPKVYRYRYPSKRIALGHTRKDHIYACHELEIYPNDLLTCGSGTAAILFDMDRAFRHMGTRRFTDDRPRGTPLPCRRRGSTSPSTSPTGARVTDCVNGRNGQKLAIPAWLRSGAPSLEGVRHVGSAHHQGRGAGRYDSTQDIDFDHEAELTKSRRFMIATDERGGGVVPPGASCAPGADNTEGNGGLHAYAVRRLDRRHPSSPRDAFGAYARTPKGRKAIFRVPVRTQPEATVCTAHVFQQIPGQNRIFMGWYSQGTQVVDFKELPNGRFRFKQAGWFIPENANTWVSSIFKVRRNRDGSFTYWGATGDFNIGAAGRNAIDVYKVTLPPVRSTFRRGAAIAPQGPDGSQGARPGSGAWVKDRNVDVIAPRGDDAVFGRRLGAEAAGPGAAAVSALSLSWTQAWLLLLLGVGLALVSGGALVDRFGRRPSLDPTRRRGGTA